MVPLEYRDKPSLSAIDQGRRLCILSLLIFTRPSSTVPFLNAIAALVYKEPPLKLSRGIC